MEDTLRVRKKLRNTLYVLILVLMEDTLREGSELGAYKTIAMS